MHVIEGKMFYKEDEVKTIPIKQSLERFLDFLEKIGRYEGVILLAHNSMRLDIFNL